jgi:hypothetical protein
MQSTIAGHVSRTKVLPELSTSIRNEALIKKKYVRDMLNLILKVSGAIQSGCKRALGLSATVQSAPPIGGTLVHYQIVPHFQKLPHLKQRILEAAGRVPTSFSPIND